MTGVQNYYSAKNRETIRRLKLALNRGPASISDASDAVGITRPRGWQLMSARIDFHIAGYERKSNNWVALWTAGPGKDAIKPKWVSQKKPRVKKPNYPQMARDREEVFYRKPISRDWSVAMLFGPGVNLNAELSGMHS